MNSNNRTLQFFAAFLVVLLVGACLCMAGFGLGFLTGTMTGGRSSPVVEAVTAPVTRPPAPTATPRLDQAPVNEGKSAAPTATPKPSVQGTPVPAAVAIENFDVFWEALRLLDDNFDGKVPEASEVTKAAIAGVQKAAEGCEDRSAQPVTPATVATPDTPSAAPENFAEFWQAVDEIYSRCGTDGFPPAQIPFVAFDGVSAGLDDKYTDLLPPDRAESFRIELDSGFEGIGASVNDAEGGGVTIVRPFADSPAEKAGLRGGDVIVAVDGKDITPLLLDEAIRLIRGPADSKVVLTIRRQGEDKTFDVEVIRDRINIPVLQSENLDGKVLHVSLFDFSSRAEDELRKSLQEATGSGTKAVILDLRGNPGGRLDVAIDIASMFIEDGVIVSESGHRNEEHKATGKAIVPKLPVAILVDGGSASASEIVAGAIQDYARGALIGEKTFGKGSVQSLFDLADGSLLRVTTARWFTPKGRGIQDEGLDPDIVVPFDSAAKDDKQLQAAVDYLNEQLQKQ